MGFRREQRTSRPGQVGGFFPSTQASALVPLSREFVVGRLGLEPRTSGLKVRCAAIAPATRGTRETRTSTPKIRSGMAVSVPTDETNCYLPVRSRCLHPGQQHGRRWPSSSSSWVRRMRRARVVACLASSTQQMNSLRASGVMSVQASSAVGLATSASRRSPGSSCTTPPATRWLLMATTVTVVHARPPT